MASSLLAATLVLVPSGTPVEAAGLAISKSSSDDVVESGQTFDYSILVSCSTTTGDCVNAVVTDVLPPELSGAASDVFIPPLIGATGTYDEASRTVTWTFTNDLGASQIGMATGSSVELLVSVKFPAGGTPNNAVAINTATFTADTDVMDDTAVSNAHAVTSTATFGFIAQKSVSGGVANIGIPVTYDIELCSDPTGGLDMEPGATLQDTLPAGAEFVSASGGTLETFPGSGVVEWTLPAVAANGVCQVVGNVTVNFPDTTFSENDVVTNQVSVLDPVPLGATVAEPPIDASLNTTLVLPTGEGGAGKAGAEWVTAGQPFNYTLTIDSVGFLAITDAVLTDVIPDQIDVTSVTVPAGVDRVFYTSDLDPTLRPLAFTAGVPVAKSTLVGPTDFIATLQIEADNVGAFQSVNTVMGAQVIDGGVDRGSVPIIEGAAQPDGTLVTNCTSLTYVDHLSVAQTPADACTDTLVKQEFAVPRITKTGDSGPFIPGTTVSWEITLINGLAASTELDEFIVRDLLPDQYDDGTAVAMSYVPGSAALVSKPAGAPDPVIVESVDAPSARTQLDFRWTSADGTAYALQPGETITVTYEAILPLMTPPGTITNHASLSNWLNEPTNPDPDKRLVWDCDPPAVSDPDLVALNATDAASGNPCYASSPVGVQAITGLGSIKWVRGEADLDIVIGAAGDPNDPDPETAGFTRFPASGFTYPGGFVDYRVILDNPGNVPTNDLVIVDIFPFVGDSGVLTGTRGSEWRPILIEPITLPVELTGLADVYYSIEEDPCRDARLKIPAGCTDWSLTPPDPISDTHAVMIDIADSFEIVAGGELQIDLRLTAPAGAQIDGTIAWNSFGFSSARADTGTELLAAEPRKVGVEVRVPSNALYGDYVWFDFDHDGLQDAEETGPELVDQPARLTGINGVRVQYYEDETGDGPTADDRFVRTTVTQDDFAGNPGFYSFPELDAGSYYAVFDVPTGLELSLVDQGGNDAVDSDADFDTLTFEGATIIDTLATVATQVVMPSTALGPDEIDLTWDVGFWDPTNLRSSLGDLVWYDNNTTGIQDGSPDGVAGVTVNLWWVGEDGVKNDTGGDDIEVDSMTTDATGNYRFDWLVPGTNYYVEFVEPAGHVLTTLDTGGDDAIDSDADPATDLTALIDLDNGPDPAAVAWDPDTQTVEPQWDAGLFFPNTIGNFVWEDLDRDGLQDGGEPGIGSVAVTLYSPGVDGVIGGIDDIEIATTTTTGSGFYEFTDLPNGDYFVVVTPPATYLTTSDDVGAVDAVDSDGVDGAAPYAGRVVMTSVTTLQIEPGVDTNLNTVDDIAEDDPTWDFGLYRLASLGDYVWEDLNLNGIQNSGEPGVNGVTATLLDEFGVPVPGAVTVTANNPVGGAPGFYEFTDLEPGTYAVRFDTTATTTTVDRPWFYSPRDQGGNDAADSDADPNPVSPTFAQTASTTLESNENDTTLDAGIWRWASLGDYVWHDLDGDGIQDSGEPGINGVTVTLLDIVGTPVPGAATVTANNPVGGAPGWYEFDDLDPDLYSVEFDLNSAVLTAGGFVATGQNDGGDDAVDSDASRATGVTAATMLTSNENDPTWDAGFYIPVDLGDYVWYDSSVDGLLDAGDADPLTPGIAGVNGVTVRLLDEAGTPVPGASTVTANNPVGSEPGWYEFADLRPDTYQVEFVRPTGFAFSPPNVGGDDAVDSDAVVVTPSTARTGPIVLTSGVDDFTWDAGIYQFAGLGDFAWDDLNADGDQDAGEPGINGVTVLLLDAAGDPIPGATTVTADDPVGGAPGWYEFTELVPDTYGVQFDLASPALAGYVVSPRDATGDAADSDADTADGSTVPTVLDLNEFDPTIDGGFYLPASLGDFVWDDLDGNGAQDGAESGINGVTVQLLDASLDPIVGATTVTANNPVGGAAGWYAFTGLVPGTYAVQFDLASTALTTPGYVQSPVDATADANDSDADGSGITSTTTLISGENDPTLDAGFYIPVAVGDYVWEDLDGDGLQDAGEPGVNGVTVVLLDSTGTPVPGATTVTANNPVGGASGWYEFIDLDPGIYSVRFDLTTVPAGFVPTIRDVDLDVSDAIDSDADATTGATAATPFLESGDSDQTLDMGLVLPVVVGDFVWHDLDGDGVFDTGEPPLDGVDVDLYLVDPLGGPATLVGSTSTAASGLYQFIDLTPGSYYVIFDLSTLPAGMVATLQNQGGDDAVDSDADTATGQTAPTAFLLSQQSDLTLDMGAYFPVTVGDFVWDDLDGDGVQDAGEPGLNGVTVQLLDAAGDPIVGTTTTTANNPAGGAPGFYEFSGLPPAAYAVDFDLTTLPAGYVVSPRNQGSDDTLDSDGDLTTGATAVGTAMTSGGSDPTHDLGVYLPVAVGDLVFEDLDGDGVQDAAEPGVEGVGVTLFLVDPLGGPATEIGTDTTDTDGIYGFSDLVPGSYFVTFDLATLPIGFVATFPNVGGDDGLDSDPDRLSGQTAPTPFLSSGAAADLSLDMGIFEPVAVGDLVFEDLDGDGVQDASDVGVEGVDVTLFLVDPAGGTPTEIGTETTDADGLYGFGDLAPGSYYVIFDLATLPAGFVVTFPNVGGDDSLDSDADRLTGQAGPTPFLNSGAAADLSLDMGIFQPLTVGDFAWDDLDGDGVQDAGEPGVEGVDVTLFLVDPLGGPPTEIGTETTDTDGAYEFVGLDPGEFFVVFDLTTLPGGYVPTFDNVGDEALDSDADPLTGATRTTGFLDSQSTDRDLDIGLFIPVAVGDFVWFDLSGDGVQDAGEPGVEGIGVTLFSVGPDGVADTADDVDLGATATDVDGAYEFIDLPPGSYYVVFDLDTLPVGQLATATDRGDDATDSDADRTTGQTPATGPISSGSEDRTLDMGIVVPVAIGDYVWDDRNADGIQDSEESGIAGVTVNLLLVGPDGIAGSGDDVFVATMITGTDGDYLFTNQVPGNYFVEFDLTTLPDGYVVTLLDVGSDDTVDSDADPSTGITRPTGDLDGTGVDTNDIDLDLGVYIPAVVGDFVWEDRNGDGVQQAGEPGVGGVRVVLIDPGPDGVAGTADDIEVDSVTTDADGGYLFTGVRPSDYVIEVDIDTLPGGAIFSPPGVGSPDSDSDIDPATGRTPIFTVSFDGDDRTWDGGFFVPFDLRLTKAADGDFRVGSTGTFLLTVTNVGPGVAFGPLELVDELPTGLTFNNAVGAAWSCGAVGQTVTCLHNADLAANATAELRLVVNVTALASSGIVNTASVRSLTAGDIDSSVPNNTASSPPVIVLQAVADLPRTGQSAFRPISMALILLGLGVALTTLASRRRGGRRA